jgi:hypothetical protein
VKQDDPYRSSGVQPDNTYEIHDRAADIAMMTRGSHSRKPARRVF